MTTYLFLNETTRQLQASFQQGQSSTWSIPCVSLASHPTYSNIYAYDIILYMITTSHMKSTYLNTHLVNDDATPTVILLQLMSVRLAPHPGQHVIMEA